MEIEQGTKIAHAAFEIPFLSMVLLLGVPFDPKMVVEAVVAWENHRQALVLLSGEDMVHHLACLVLAQTLIGLGYLSWLRLGKLHMLVVSLALHSLPLL